MKTVESLETSLLPYRKKLLEHPLYNKLKTEESIKVFMSYHSFAVWDFMSLVKSLQLKLTSTQIPWTPVGNPSTRRLINEIVLGEESDIDQNNNPISHFELYVEAMDRIGAKTDSINTFVENINGFESIDQAIDNSLIPDAAKDFMKFTFDIINNKEVHVLSLIHI